jgi:hypothetical protein
MLGRKGKEENFQFLEQNDKNRYPLCMSGIPILGSRLCYFNCLVDPL